MEAVEKLVNRLAASNVPDLIQQYAKRMPVSPWTLASWIGLPWILYRSNRYLSQRAMNNGVDATFDWKREMVLVTGGSNGIGAACAQKLASRGTQVIVLDILPLTYEAREYISVFNFYC